MSDVAFRTAPPIGGLSSIIRRLNIGNWYQGNKSLFSSSKSCLFSSDKFDDNSSRDNLVPDDVVSTLDMELADISLTGQSSKIQHIISNHFLVEGQCNVCLNFTFYIDDC